MLKYCLVVRRMKKESELEKMLPCYEVKKEILENVYYFKRGVSEREILKITKALVFLKAEYWRFEKLD